MDENSTDKPTPISLAWVAIVVLAIIPTLYFFAHLRDPAFVDSTMGNWFATIVGVGVGIPIAFWIAHRQQEQQQKRETATKQEEASRRKAKILDLLREELESNYHSLYPTWPPRPFLKDGLWTALSDSGELQWIDDLLLLSLLANAYYYVRRTNTRGMYAHPSDQAVSEPDGGFGPAAIQAGMSSIIPDAIQAFKDALGEIQKSREGLGEEQMAQAEGNVDP